MSKTRGWSNLEAPFVAADGTPTAISPRGDAVRMLTTHQTPANGSLIRCSYVGEGELSARGSATEASVRPSQFTILLGQPLEKNVVWLQVPSADPATLIDPDYRQADAPGESRFPGSVGSLNDLGMLRFVDWKPINANAPA